MNPMIEGLSAGQVGLCVIVHALDGRTTGWGQKLFETVPAQFIRYANAFTFTQTRFNQHKPITCKEFWEMLIRRNVKVW